MDFKSAIIFLNLIPLMLFAQEHKHQSIPSNSSLGTVVFTDSLHGWITSEPGTLLRTLV